MWPTQRASARLLANCVRCYSHGKRLGILGVPFGKGQKKEGVMREGLEAGPDALRATSLVQDLQYLGISVKDFGNVKATSTDPSANMQNMINFADVMATNQLVSEAVFRILKDGRTCLTIGGDHSLFAGTIHGHVGAQGAEDVAVVYVDAHADINLSTTTVTGNVHGMPVAMSSRELQHEWDKCPLWLQPKRSISLRNVGYIGLRSVDPPELDLINKYGVAAYTMNDVVEYGIAEVLRQILRRIDPDARKSIHLSIDTDSLDPSVAPSTTIPVPGGLQLRELMYITSVLGKTGRVRVIDWVEINPLKGSDRERKSTLDAAVASILAFFGG